MRDLLFAAVLSWSVVSGCRSAAPETSRGSPRTEPPPRAPAAAAEHGPDAPRAPVGETVALAFRDADRQPIIGRTVRVVDVRGARFEGLTDEEGGMFAAGVVAPFDVIVEGSPSLGARAAPTVLLGLTAAEVAWALEERDESPPPPAQTFRLALPPACEGPTCAAWIATASPSGRGEAHLEARAGGGIEVASVSHVFSRAVLERGERVAVHAVVASADRTWLAVAAATADAAPGEVTDVGTLVPAVLPTREVVAELDRSAVGADWSAGLEASLRMGDGVEEGQARTAGATLAFRAPEAPAASALLACVRAWAERPTRTGEDLHAGAQSVVCPQGASRVTVSLASPLEPLAPRPGEALSRRGQGMRWEASGRPRLVDVHLVDELAARVVVRVVTSGNAVPTTALARLGVSLPLGPMVADVRATEEAELDAAAGPRAREPLSSRRTSRRYRFVVTP